MLLKLTAIFRYSELVISFGVWAIQEVKDLEERMTFLENEKLVLEKAKQELSSKLAEEKEQVRLKNQ